MEFFHAAVLGIVQGLTEFLPVSSSGHLWLLQDFWGANSQTFEVFLHAGSLVAVVVFFRKKIWEIFRGMFRGDSLGWKLLAATVFTAPLAIFCQKFFLLELSVFLVSITLFVTAGLILAAEFFRPKLERTFSWNVAIALGIVQGISVLPGISRSGLTIAFLILLGVPRRQSAELSFLLSIPTILGALFFTMLDNQNDFSVFLSPESWLGFFLSAVAAAAAIAWMMKLIQKNWIWFAPYCAGLSAVLFFLSK
ncbi:undecaprenyl-diphosphate phosphatase [bacterium]|jgi:undecaprenyl-diphosphatase|nr:undecaprenyl-diphosphate phosphatase [bacterium]MBT6831611.1 undecaprenyl-diphosphate phosphatase [bacterium]MBT6996256.1 undecaprenyl-diphosphate phosphatase [bacterium]MBT7772934.1 undecaprenyl-diphosphate phosphatase [bacterium]